MSDKLTIEDYPLSEKRPELIAGQRGRKLGDITLDALASGEVQMEDLRITRQALQYQAEIARAAGRPTLAENFERGAELVDVPERRGDGAEDAARRVQDRRESFENRLQPRRVVELLPRFRLAEDGG